MRWKQLVVHPTVLGKYTAGGYAITQIREMCNTKDSERLTAAYISEEEVFRGAGSSCLLKPCDRSCQVTIVF